MISGYSKKKKILTVLALFFIILAGCGKTEVIPLSADEDYYSLAEQNIVTNVKSQLSGTCWVTAAATSLESSYKISTGEDIEVNPVDILNAVLNDEKKKEGYYAKEHVDIFDIGGCIWQVAETLSNGFGEYVLVDASSYFEQDITTIKEGIKNNGAIAIGVNDSNYYRVDGYKTLIASIDDDRDHAVTLIGWDDNFPKENFCYEASQNGAFIAQNTRSAYWGKDGCYMMSYDTYFDDSYTLKMSDEYSQVLFYDAGCQNKIRVGETTTLANVFQGEGKLKAVGTYTAEPDQKLIVEVYDADFKKKYCSQEASFALPGYHVIDLKKKINLKNYAIAFTYEGDAPVEGEAWDDGNIVYDVHIGQNESYVKLNDEWCDMYDEETISQLGIDFRPNNACIKALY